MSKMLIFNELEFLESKKKCLTKIFKMLLFFTMTEGKIKHLELIQNTISRMAQNSFTIRGWAVTLVTAIMLVAHKISGWEYILVALLPAFIFWGLDAYYLKWERLFRELYDKVRNQPKTEWESDPFSFNIKSSSNKSKKWFSACWASCIVWLYLPMIILIICVTIYISKID